MVDSIDDILKVQSPDELVGFMDKESLVFSRRISRKMDQSDPNISARQYVKGLYEGLGLSFAGAYVNGDLNVSVETDRRTGDILYTKVTGISPFVDGCSPSISFDSGHARLTVPLVFREKFFGSAVFEKPELSLGAVVQILDASFDFSSKISNLTEKESLKRQARTDFLTGAFNRRQFDADYSNFVGNAMQLGQDFSVILFDIDHFKMVNDTYGHSYGDCVLQSVASLIKANARSFDLVYRWGGEEFVVICPGASAEEAESVGRKVKDAIRAYRFKGDLDFDVARKCYNGRRDSSKIRVSSGVASTQEGNFNIFNLADERLFKVKNYCRDGIIGKNDIDCFTGIAGIDSFIQHLDTQIRKCNRDDTSIAVMLFDVVRFSEVIRTVGNSVAWGFFYDVAKWLYSEKDQFSYVARVCDRDNMVLALPSRDGDIGGFMEHVSGMGRSYLGVLRSWTFPYLNGCEVSLDFAVGCAVYDPRSVEDRSVLESRPYLLYGLAERLAAKAGDVDSRMVVDIYADVSKR